MTEPVTARFHLESGGYRFFCSRCSIPGAGIPLEAENIGENIGMISTFYGWRKTGSREAEHAAFCAGIFCILFGCIFSYRNRKRQTPATWNQQKCAGGVSK